MFEKLSEKITVFTSFLDIERENFGFLTKFFYTFVKTAFYVASRTILTFQNFPKVNVI